MNIGVAGWLILRLGFLLLIYNDSRVRSSFALLPVPIIEFFLLGNGRLWSSQ